MELWRGWRRFLLLKAGGRIFFTTPNADSWRSLATLALRGHHQEFTDESYSAHITASVGADLKSILPEAGFASIEIQLCLALAASWRRQVGQPPAGLAARPAHRQARGGKMTAVSAAMPGLCAAIDVYVK